MECSARARWGLYGLYGGGWLSFGFGTLEIGMDGSFALCAASFLFRVGGVGERSSVL